MKKKGSPEHRRRQSDAMKKWFADPANREAHSQRQRKRFTTDEGKAHIAKITAKAVAIKQKYRAIPREYEKFNREMRRQGMPAVKRLEAIRKRMEEEAKQYD